MTTLTTCYQTIVLFLRRLLPARIRTYYRGWKLEVTAVGVVGRQKDSGEYFIIARLSGIEQALRLAKNKVDRLQNTTQ